MVYKFFDKKSSGSRFVNEMNFIGRLLENSKDEKFIHVLETVFGVLI